VSVLRRLVGVITRPVRGGLRRAAEGFRARRLTARSRQRRTAGTIRRLRLLGWHGNRAAGDDLLGVCVQQVFDRAARDLGLELEFVTTDDTDLVVIGGGTLLGPAVPAIADAFAGPDVPLVIFGTGFRSETSLLGGEQAERFTSLLRRASLCGVRGYLSQHHCVINGVHDIEVIGDPGLSFQPVEVAAPSGEPAVGVMVRAMGKTGEPQYLENERIFDMVADLADHFVEELGATLHFFSLAENIHDSDREGAEAVMERMRTKEGDRVRFLGAGEEPIGAFSRVASMDYVISQRLHPTVIAWQQGKPCVAFDYQFNKTADFMGSIGMEDLVVRTDEYSRELYFAKYERLMSNRSALAEQARRAVDHWSERQLDFARRALVLIR
jgi:hypothetical protein